MWTPICGEQCMDEKVSIQVASHALKVSEKTIRRYIEKGILSTVKEGRRVFIPSDEIRELRSGHPKAGKIFHIPRKDKVVVDRTHYDGLLTRLGYLEKEQQLMLEYKDGLKGKNEELIETRNWLEESIQENKRIEKQAQKKVVNLEEQNRHIKSSSIFTLQKRASEIEELKKSISAFNQKIQDLDVKNTKLKKRNIFQRIFNVDE